MLLLRIRRLCILRLTEEKNRLWEDHTMARVLALDDESTILVVLSALLKADGHEVVTLAGGNEAVEAIETQEFDLLISDVRMDPIDGFQFLKLAKKVHPEMPVIMITAYYSLEKAKEMTRMGAFACLKKPFDLPQLQDVVGRAVNKTESK